MARKPSRAEWRQSKNGLWTRSLGTRGARVKLFERTKGGGFYRDVWIPGRGRDRKSLGTSDRMEAERLGKQLLSALLRDEEIERAGVLPLGALWERYRRDAVSFSRLSKDLKDDETRRAAILTGFFGKDCDVRELSEKDQAAYTEKRLAGGIEYGKKVPTRAVRLCSVDEDLKLLHKMLRWATTVRVGKGGRLLERNPLEGVRRSGGGNERRPIATFDRFQKTRAAVRTEIEQTESDQARRKWLKLEMALVLAEATGRRIGSIRQLRWQDVDFTAATIRWRAEADKKRKEWVVPIPPELRDELKAFRLKLGGVFGGLMFPSDLDPHTPMRKDVLSNLLKSVEKKANLPKLDGSLWHAYRRAWATSRKDLPAADVAAAGGWSSLTTLLKCYQQADHETMLSVMSHPRKLVERASNQ